MPPFKLSNEAWYAKPEDDDYAALHQRALNGEVDEWSLEGVHLFAHPERLDGGLLSAYASIEGIVEEFDEPELVVESEATRAWKEAKTAQQTAERDRQLGELQANVEKAKNGELFPYHIVEAVPISLEERNGAKEFRQKVLGDPFSGGLMGFHFDESSDIEAVANKLEITKYPSLLIPLTAEDLPTLVERELVCIAHLYKNPDTDWTDEDKAVLHRSRDQLTASFRTRPETWRIIPKK